MSRLIDNLLVFGRLLRRAGIDVHAGRLLDLMEALGHVNLGDRDEVYFTCRALLVHRHEHIPIFDRAFDAFWRQHGEELQADALAPGAPVEAPVEFETLAEEAIAIQDVDDAGDGTATPERALRIWSDRRSLSQKDFASLTPEEVKEAQAALANLTWTPGERRTRRWVRGRGPRPDLRRALADSVRTGGDVVRLTHQRRRRRPRPLVLLCDVSGSMEQYSRMLIRFAHALTQRHRRVEAFLFSTELTRITRELHTPNVDDALAAVSRAVRDWSGGTRIGGAVKEFHRRWSRRVLHGGPVVLLISDGWDRGDPAEVRHQIARLQRGCHRLIWLNPLIGTADYAPLTRGLQAALPYVDDFLPARTLANLADLAIHLNALA